ncbi:MAG: serine/threonine-protein kinase [Pirellula sp.]
MSSLNPKNYPKASVEQLVDNTCRDFETKWREGKCPSIKHFLLRVPHELRHAVLLELTLLEQQLSRSKQKTVRTKVASDQLEEGLTQIPTLLTAKTQASLPASFGNYEPKYSLGSGASGDVFAAVDSSDGHYVAIKWAHSYLAAQDDLDRFLKEADNASKLDHPNIVKYICAGEQDSRPFIVFEYLNGIDLRELLRAKVTLTHEQILSVIATVCRALQFAHDRDLIHRDIKPSNMMVVLPELMDIYNDPLAEHLDIRILDFGIAKQIDATAHLTVTGERIGTPMYMSPEQASGQSKNLDHRSDIYCLGVVFYELLTGSRPFAGNSDTVVNNISRNEVPLIAKTHPEIPFPIATICQRCLRLSPNDRYSRMSDIADDIDRYRVGKPIRAKPVGWIESVRSTWRQKELTRPAIAAVLTGLIAFAVASVYILTRPSLPQRLHSTDEPKLRPMQAWIRGLPESLTDKQSLSTALQQSQVVDLVEFVRSAKVDASPFLGVLKELLSESKKSEADESAMPGGPSSALLEATLSSIAPQHVERIDLKAVAKWVSDVYLPKHNEAWSEFLLPFLEQFAKVWESQYRQTSLASDRAKRCHLLATMNCRDPARLVAFLENAYPQEIPTWSYSIGLATEDMASLLKIDWSPFESQDKFVKESDCVAAANRALAQFATGNLDVLREALRDRPDPRLRTYVMHQLVETGLSVNPIISQMMQEDRADVLYGLTIIAALFDRDQIHRKTLSAGKEWVASTYRQHPDAGVHSMCGILLDRWDLADERRKASDEFKLAERKPDHEWFVHPLGIPFAVVRGPVDIKLGKPITKEEFSGIHDHSVHIDRS